MFLPFFILKLLPRECLQFDLSLQSAIWYALATLRRAQFARLLEKKGRVGTKISNKNNERIIRLETTNFLLIKMWNLNCKILFDILRHSTPSSHFNVIIFILKIIVKPRQMLLKTNKNHSKTKAISYILSGINIKRMIQDQMISQSNASQISIIRVNKRPIFKIKEKEKENNASLLSSLPNKSFKIRSYTKKTKEGGKDDESCEIFEKVQKLRNYRVNSNRIEIFNLSRENRVDREDKESKIQTKIKQILQREASIKCKVSNQVFVKEVLQKQTNMPIANFTALDTQKYREIAHKINVFFNPNCQGVHQRKKLMVISLQALHVHSKRMVKSSSSGYEQVHHNKPEKQPLISQEQLELLKMLSGKYYPKDTNWSQLKIAFKVSNSQELQQLKNVLQSHQINDYYCIFYPIRKYVECWNLYQIDCLLENTSSIVILEAKYKIKEEFPIIPSSIKSLFIQTNIDSFVTLSRTISALKYFIIQTNSIPKCSNLLIAIQDEDRFEKKDEEETKSNSNRPCIAQFSSKQEVIEINASELNARLDFVLNSRQLKSGNMRSHNRSTLTAKDIKGKRRTLCERQTNIPLPNFKPRNFYNNFASASAEDKWDIDLCKQDKNLDNMREKILLSLQNQNRSEPISLTKPYRKMEISDKSDETDEITNSVRFGCKSKTNHQIVSELIKRNSHIFKQTEDFVHAVSFLNTNYKDVLVSSFEEKQDTNQEPAQEAQLGKLRLSIMAYKIS